MVAIMLCPGRGAAHHCARLRRRCVLRRARDAWVETFKISRDTSLVPSHRALLSDIYASSPVSSKTVNTALGHPIKCEQTPTWL